MIKFDFLVYPSEKKSMKKLFLICCAMFVGTNSVHAARLAEREKLKRQLLSVNTGCDNCYLEKMYPTILKEAEKDLQPSQVVSVFEAAQQEYLSYILENTISQEQADIFILATITNVTLFTAKLIRSILPNDKVEADEAIGHYNQIHGLFESEVSEGYSDS